MPETPLGSIVQIRSEIDAEVIKQFTPSQRKIRAEWQEKQNMKETTKANRTEQTRALFEALRG